MLKYKYKLHHFINILFYGIFWVSGLLVGLGLKGSHIYENIKEVFIKFIN